MPTCLKCGNALDPQSMYCDNCGSINNNTQIFNRDKLLNNVKLDNNKQFSDQKGRNKELSGNKDDGVLDRLKETMAKHRLENIGANGFKTNREATQPPKLSKSKGCATGCGIVFLIFMFLAFIGSMLNSSDSSSNTKSDSSSKSKRQSMLYSAYFGDSKSSEEQTLNSTDPNIVKVYLDKLGLQTGSWKDYGNDEYGCCSSYRRIGTDLLISGILENNLAYYIDGTKYKAEKLMLVLNINNKKEAALAHRELLKAVDLLVKKSLGIPLPESLIKAINNGTDISLTEKECPISLKKDIAPTKVYSLIFTIQE